MGQITPFFFFKRQRGDLTLCICWSYSMSTSFHSKATANFKQKTLLQLIFIFFWIKDRTILLLVNFQGEFWRKNFTPLILFHHILTNTKLHYARFTQQNIFLHLLQPEKSKCKISTQKIQPHKITLKPIQINMLHCKFSLIKNAN